MDIFQSARRLSWAFLPHRQRCAGAGGRALSALLVALLPTCIAAPLNAAEPGARAQIEQAIDAYFAQALKQEAARQGWQGARISHDSSLPASAAKLATCPQAPQVRASGAAPLLERQRLEIRCNAAPGWSLELTSQAQVLLPVVHASGIIDRGQPLTAADLRLEPINISKAQRGYFNRLEEVTGKTAKRRIRAGQLLPPALLALPLAVRRGQPVKIVASHDGIEASTSGEALVDGQPGEVIRVRNVRSGKVIEAKVVEEGVVTSTF